jgi:uncharacterized protein
MTSPLVLDTHDLIRQPGAMREVAKVVPAPADLGNEMISVPEGSDLILGLRLESVMEGVLVSGAVRATAVGECSRCLEPISDEVTVRISQLFVYPERYKAAVEAGDEDLELESLEDGGDGAILDGDLADIEPVIRDAIVTALPFRPLCRPDCPGLCPQCGVRLADHRDHQHDQTDPRWSALADLLPNLAADGEKTA